MFVTTHKKYITKYRCSGYMSVCLFVRLSVDRLYALHTRAFVFKINFANCRTITVDNSNNRVRVLFGYAKAVVYESFFVVVVVYFISLFIFYIRLCNDLSLSRSLSRPLSHCLPVLSMNE